jgi:hypothetical protein
MNIYQSIGSNIGTPEAADLADRLAAWHDAMVGHERLGRQKDACHDECPHTDAGPLWEAALETFGARARELQFLKSRAAANAQSARRASRRAAAEARA